MRRTVLVFAATAVVLAGGVYGLAWATTGSFYWSRVLIWQDADFADWQRFPSRPIANDPSRAFALRRAAGADAAWPQRVSGGSLEDVVAANGSAAFIILRGDQILYERYANGYTAESTMTSFSIAKSFVSALVGRAGQDGHLRSVDERITAYLPELKGRGVDDVTIAHLLAMASGIRYDGAGSGGGPFQDDAKAYYDPNLRTLALQVRGAGPPGVAWQYNNYHPILIGLILERATGMNVSDYLSRVIWRPLGMEAPGSWSLDSVVDAFEKMESGLNARPRTSRGLAFCTRAAERSRAGS